MEPTARTVGVHGASRERDRRFDPHVSGGATRAGRQVSRRSGPVGRADRRARTRGVRARHRPPVPGRSERERGESPGSCLRGRSRWCRIAVLAGAVRFGRRDRISAEIPRPARGALTQARRGFEPPHQPKMIAIGVAVRGRTGGTRVAERVPRNPRGKRNAPPDGDPTTVLGGGWGAWGRRKESNLWSAVYETAALPLSYAGAYQERVVAGVGFEPTSPASEAGILPLDDPAIRARGGGLGGTRTLIPALQERDPAVGRRALVHLFA